MKYYLLMTTRQWQELQKQKEDNSIIRPRSFIFNTIIQDSKLKPVRYDYSSKMDDIALNIKMSVKTYTQPLKSLVYIMVRIPIIKMIKSSQPP